MLMFAVFATICIRYKQLQEYYPQMDDKRLVKCLKFKLPMRKLNIAMLVLGTLLAFGVSMTAIFPVSKFMCRSFV